MRSSKWAVGCVLVLFAALSGCARLSLGVPVEVPGKQAVVLLPAEHLPGHVLAAEELALHLRKLSGRPVPILSQAPWPGSYPFHIGVQPASDRQPLRAGECRYVTTAEGAYFYGDDTQPGGTLFAVYDFLERECGVVWPIPGEIAFRAGERRDGLVFRTVRRSWRPRLQPRRMMGPASRCQAQAPCGPGAEATAELKTDPEVSSGRAEARLTWLRRHRMTNALPGASAAGQRIPPVADTCGAAPGNADLPKCSDLQFGAGALLDFPAGDWRRWRRGRSGGDLVLHSEALTPCIGLPMGLEKRVFEFVRAAQRRGMTGANLVFDPGSWWLRGPACYTLARTQYRPDIQFEELEEEFCLPFGAADADVKLYWRFWREHHESRIAPNREMILAEGFGNWEQGISDGVADYYSLDDFRQSLGFLYQGLTRDLGDPEKRRLQELILAHDHAERIFLALNATNRLPETPDDLKANLAASRALIDFRRAWRNGHLRACVAQFTAREMRLGDVTGLDWARLFEDAEPYAMLPLSWRFRTDPDDGGEKNNWQGTDAAGFGEWDEIRADRPWERQEPNSCAVAEYVREYRGTAWYAATVSVDSTLRERDVFLNVRGCMLDCEVFLNAQSVGEHRLDPGKTRSGTFRVQLNSAFADEDGEQPLIIRVRDKSPSPRGIRHPLWLSTRERKKPENDAKPGRAKT